MDALHRSGWEGRRVGKEWKGPCPLCGGTDRFHVGRGTKGADVLAYCRHCTPENASARAEWLKELVQHLFPHEQRWQRTRHGPSKRPRRSNTRANRRNTGQKPQKGPRAARERNGGSDRTPSTPDAATAADTASGSAVACPECTLDPETGKPKPCGTCRARRMWADARPVSMDRDTPARRWAALRNLWPPGDPFPPSLRWLVWRDGGGSLVACFAPLEDWLAGDPEPTGVQLIHIAPNGQPRRDRGGLDKRSHGTIGGSVVLMGETLSDAGRIHVAEGVADALAVASRENGAVSATGGTAGFARLTRDLSRLRVPVVIWPDGDEAGQKAASGMKRALQERGAIADTARVRRHRTTLLFQCRFRFRRAMSRDGRAHQVQPRAHLAEIRIGDSCRRFQNVQRRQRTGIHAHRTLGRPPFESDHRKARHTHAAGQIPLSEPAPDSGRANAPAQSCHGPGHLGRRRRSGLAAHSERQPRGMAGTTSRALSESVVEHRVRGCMFTAPAPET